MSVRSTLMTPDGVALAVDDAGGGGRIVVFQHGLTGDAGQTAELFPDNPAWRRITLECRGHGRSQLGDPARLTIPAFADDVAQMIATRDLSPLAVGGISTYAAVAAFPSNILLIAFLFGTLGILSSATWLGFGTGLKRLLKSPRAVRAVNIAMALLLVASLWPILADAWR